MRGPIFNIIDYFTGRGSLEDVIYSVFGVLAFLFVCIPVHECSHALAAKILGDNTAENQGRLTLNPFAHIDLTGTVMMFLCSIGWAKPTPVDLRRCTKVNIRAANAIVSAAGPLSNIIMSFLFVVIYKLIFLLAINNISTVLAQVAGIVYYVAALNAFLAVFNLIPVPPFDGYHILSSFLPAKAIVFMERYGQIINIVLIIIIFSGFLSVPISFLSGKILEFFDFATGFIL